jgi:hypothetical protein
MAGPARHRHTPHRRWRIFRRHRCRFGVGFGPAAVGTPFSSDFPFATADAKFFICRVQTAEGPMSGDADELRRVFESQSAAAWTARLSLYHGVHSFWRNRALLGTRQAFLWLIVLPLPPF